MVDLRTRLEALRERLAFPEPTPGFDLLDVPQFTNSNVQSIAEVSQAQLHNWTSRGWIDLSGDANPGKGRRRFYTGADVLAVRFAAEMAPFGMIQVAKQVNQSIGWLKVRSFDLVCGLAGDLGRKLFVIPLGNDWLYVHDISALPEACPVYLTVELDLLVIQTLERLATVVDEEEPEPLGKPVPPTLAETQSEIEEFYSVWSTDNEGRRVYSGLTFEESQEFATLQPIANAEKLHDYDEGPFTLGWSKGQQKRYHELQDRHLEGAHLVTLQKMATK